MIDHIWTVVCSRAVIDRDSNSVSLENVIEQLNIRDKPRPEGQLPISLQIATLWARSDLNVSARGTGRMTLMAPSGQAFGPFEFDVDLSEARRHRTRGTFHELPLPEPGRYVFRIELRENSEEEWHQVAAIPLEVIFTAPEAEPTEAESA